MDQDSSVNTHILDTHTLANRIVWRHDAESMMPSEDSLAVEKPIALVYNGITHVVLMATPADLVELAYGFSLSERIVAKPSEIYDVEVETVCNGIEVRLEIASARWQDLKHRRRNMQGRTGCGLCGTDSLNAVPMNFPKLKRNYSIDKKHIFQAIKQFDSHQPLRQKTGSVHGVAWIENGEVIEAYEDVGRHNAFDKLIGSRMRRGQSLDNGFALLSSRASYEMAAKAATVGIGCIVAVSAPTDLAVQIADAAGITLIGFARPNRFIVYTHPNFINGL